MEDCPRDACVSAVIVRQSIHGDQESTVTMLAGPQFTYSGTQASLTISPRPRSTMLTSLSSHFALNSF